MGFVGLVVGLLGRFGLLGVIVIGELGGRIGMVGVLMVGFVLVGVVFGKSELGVDGRLLFRFGGDDRVVKLVGDLLLGLVFVGFILSLVLGEVDLFVDDVGGVVVVIMVGGGVMWWMWLILWYMVGMRMY